MSQFEKLLEKMRRLPPEMTYSDVERVLIAFGWQERASGGSSHHMFCKGGKHVAIPKKGGKVVKTTYLKMVLKLIDEE